MTEVVHALLQYQQISEAIYGETKRTSEPDLRVLSTTAHNKSQIDAQIDSFD